MIQTQFKTQLEAIENFKEVNGDDFIEFEGHNCNDYLEDDYVECEGWQVGETRCDCGNRRVSLMTEGDSFTGYTVYAAAC